MVKWLLLPTTTTKSTAAAISATMMSARSFLAIVFVIASLVRAINGFLPMPMNGAGRALTASGTDARKLFGGYRITPKTCRATKTLPSSDPRAKGPTICMFNHECAQRSGEVVGACMDGFLFGACCQVPHKQDIESTLINDAQNAYFQQYQQHKLQMQQAMTNPLAAQSYENYGESAQQQSTEVTSGSNNYKLQQKPTTTHDYLSSSTNYRPAASSSTTETLKNEALSSSQSEQTESADSSSAVPVRQPPNLHVHKDSVKISSPSSPPHNDDFVMGVLSTLPPDHDSDQISFTTEVPTKIASSSLNQQSSESNSFEEAPTVTQIPVRLVDKPMKHNEQTKTSQQNQHTASTKPQRPQTQKPQHGQSQQQSTQHTNMHHHNHLLLDANEFTHSGITHSGADADILDEDLQFSTGYGPQPSYANAPNNKPSYDSSSTLKTPQPEDKYVLVQTISNEPGYNKQPITSGNPTTSSSITTHVDSIESIILQLNNTNHGPVYSVVNQPEQAGSYSTTSAMYQGTSDNNYNDPEANKQNSYTSTAPTESPTPYFEETDSKRPTDKYAAMTPQVPAYLEPVTTNLNFIPENEYAADAMAENSSYGPASYKPTEESPAPSDDSSALYNDHTMPNKNYNDVAGAAVHQTSEFNKMPAMGIAYPVDMSYMEEEGNIIAEEEPGYQKISTQSTSQRPSSTTVNYSGRPETAQQPASTYTRLPEVSEYESLQPSKRPIASYIGVVTAPSYQQNQPQNYNQLPDEVSVTSHTTKVHEEYDSSTSYQSPQVQKLTTINYGDTAATTAQPQSQPSTLSYASSPATAAPRPTHDSLVFSSSTAKPKPPKATKRPGQNKKKTNKPQGSKKPSTGYTQAPQNNYQQSNYKRPPTQAPAQITPPTVAYTQQQQPSVYGQQPSEGYLTNSYMQPTSTEQENPNAYQTQKQPAYQAQPSNQYAAESVESAEKQPQNAYSPRPSQPSVSYNQAQHISSPPAKATTTRKPNTGKKPISTSYVTGPSSQRPPATFAYDNEVPPLIVADDKLDSFIHSTAESIASGSPTPITNNYQAPVYANAVTPLQVQQPANIYNTHKKPGFVKIKPTIRPPAPTVIITPKPTSNSYVKQPSGDSYFPSTTPMPAFASTSYIYSSSITRRPDFDTNAPEYVSLPAITSNDFDDPGYYGAQSPSGPQSVTQATYAVPSDDRPAFPGYFGPTPTYPAFQIPGEKNDGSIEETNTSPNDFANFPPVRHPNPNITVTSSAVTSDLELSTPAFVEDGILKDKMNTLVHKIVESLQGNFEALADMIDETVTPQTYQASSTYSTTATRKPTRKPATTKSKATTKKPVTRVSTKPPTKKPTATTRKPATRRTTTRKPVTTRKPSRKPTPTTTNAAPFQDEIVDEEDEEDVNPSDNEINQGDTLSAGGGGGGGGGGAGRKIQCGVRPHVKSGRIVGGKGSTFGAFPWQVLVRESTWLGLFTKNKCGGVLITSKYVVTAAHCQPGFLASLVAVMGEFDISGDLESKKSVTKNVKRVIVHRQYDPATFENDLALLELDSPVQFDTHIVPICMPNDQADFTGRMATVTGWGRLKYGGGVPSVLQEVQVPIIENNVCQEMFHTAGHNKKIINSFLCAGYANGQKDSCEGDSGGPLVLQRPDGRYELAGTVSHGIKCAAPYLPGVYMRTTYYKPWLRAITGVK